MSKEIKTPFGSINTEVSLFPIYYLIFIYGFVYILPYGKIDRASWFDWLRSEDGSNGCSFLNNFNFIFAFLFLQGKRKEINHIWF